MLKHEIRITLRVEGIITKANECMSMELKAFMQMDVQGKQQNRFQEGREAGEVVKHLQPSQLQPLGMQFQKRSMF